MAEVGHGLETVALDEFQGGRFEMFLHLWTREHVQVEENRVVRVQQQVAPGVYCELDGELIHGLVLKDWKFRAECPAAFASQYACVTRRV